MTDGKREFKLWLEWRLHRRFKTYARKHGHSMSWYLIGYIRGLTEGKRGEGHVSARRKKKSPASVSQKQG
jgi:hypothetical protein